MTSIWVAEHGWVCPNAIIDCCTREIVGWDLSLRCRAAEAIAVIEAAVTGQGISPGTLTLGTDNGSAFTARATRLVMSGLGVGEHPRRDAHVGPRVGRYLPQNLAHPVQCGDVHAGRLRHRGPPWPGTRRRPRQS